MDETYDINDVCGHTVIEDRAYRLRNGVPELRAAYETLCFLDIEMLHVAECWGCDDRYCRVLNEHLGWTEDGCLMCLKLDKLQIFHNKRCRNKKCRLTSCKRPTLELYVRKFFKEVMREYEQGASGDQELRLKIGYLQSVRCDCGEIHTTRSKVYP